MYEHTRRWAIVSDRNWIDYECVDGCSVCVFIASHARGLLLSAVPAEDKNLPPVRLNLDQNPHMCRAGDLAVAQKLILLSILCAQINDWHALQSDKKRKSENYFLNKIYNSAKISSNVFWRILLFWINSSKSAVSLTCSFFAKNYTFLTCCICFQDNFSRRIQQ